MVKFVFLVVSVLLIASAYSNIPQEEARMYMPIIAKCVQKWKIDYEDMFEIFSGNFPVAKKFKEFLLCFGNLSGMLDDNGILQRDVIKEHIAMHIKDNDEVDKLMNKCVVQFDVPQDTAYHMGKCLHSELFSTMF